MGLLDSLLGAVSNAQGQQAQTNDPKAMLIQAALSMLTNQSGAGGANSGGLGGLLSQFQNAGLGDVVSSWVGHGENQPVSPDQVQQALGSSGQLDELAQATGLSKEETAGHLSEILPELINKLTPNGQAQEVSGGLGELAGMLGNLLGNKPA
ncbi:hypothetical protein C7W93_22650 [Glaciimonas sp. PCH181]|nr:hypothetical protein C7W93_22650 [Glaciimonas sp. PCH181]